MYAIISDRSNQATVRVGDVITCDLMTDEAGTPVEFKEILLVGNEGTVTVGKPTVAGAVVRGEVIGRSKGKKLVVFRFHRRKNVRVKRGHRQHYTQVRITEISA